MNSKISIKENLEAINTRIQAACKQCARDPNEIRIVAVGKGQPIEKLQEAYDLGLREFGENYVQEALEKMQALPHDDIVWHFIGRIQSNKIPEIAQHFDWVQSLSSLKHAKLLNQHRSPELPPLNICIQLNISDEASKSGISKEEGFELAKEIQQLPQLNLCGVMGIAEQTNDAEKQRKQFHYLKACFNNFCDLSIFLSALSGGMSNDFEAAIVERATVLRLGTALYGTRVRL